MKYIFIIALIFYSFCCLAQPSQYVAAKSGLSMRDKPDIKATVIGKIPYGTKISVTYGDIININTEGIEAAWAKVTYEGKTGYIVNAYLFPYAPPKPSVKTMKDYLAQLSPVFGAKMVLKKGDMNEMDDDSWELHKQLYKNGGEWHELQGYEYFSHTYFLPEFTIPEGFLLVRLIPEFKEVFGPQDEFPTQNKTVKKGDIEYVIKVETELLGENVWYKKISVSFAEGAVVSFEMFQMDNQLVISMSSYV